VIVDLEGKQREFRVTLERIDAVPGVPDIAMEPERPTGKKKKPGKATKEPREKEPKQPEVKQPEVKQPEKPEKPVEPPPQPKEPEKPKKGIDPTDTIDPFHPKK